MTASKFTLPIQRSLIGLNVVQALYLSASYFSSAFANRFPIFEGMFKVEIVKVCTSSSCWQSIVPFLGSTYASIAVFSVIAFFFRPGRELRLIILGIASVHIVMATTRLFVVPPEFYLEGVGLKASSFQYFLGVLLVISSALPYSKTQLESSN